MFEGKDTLCMQCVLCFERGKGRKWLSENPFCELSWWWGSASLGSLAHSQGGVPVCLCQEDQLCYCSGECVYVHTTYIHTHVFICTHTKLLENGYIYKTIRSTQTFLKEDKVDFIFYIKHLFKKKNTLFKTFDLILLLLIIGFARKIKISFDIFLILCFHVLFLKFSIKFPNT